MDKSLSPFAAAYAQWLESLLALIPGVRLAGLSSELVRRQEQVAANEEWEGEGGMVRVMDPPAPRTAPKIPL